MELSNVKQLNLPHKSSAVIYEVNLSIDVEVIERFDEWLHRHTEEMLAIPGFISAATSVPDVEDENRKHRCVQYRLSDQAALDDYFQNHAEEMQAKSLQHFEGHFSANQRVLSVAEAALAKYGTCANCGAQLEGRFCAVCGQREEPRVPTLGAISGEVTNEVFGVESKLWRSVFVLLTKPGVLTATYLSGMRQKYMSPIRLYLLFSIATFAYFALLNNQNELARGIEPVKTVSSEERLNDETFQSELDQMEFEADFLSSEVNAQIEKRLKRAVTSIRSDIESGNSKAVINKFIEPLPTALFLFLPIVALLFKLLYLGSGKYYVEHLIYVLHNHAFMFALIALVSVSSKVAEMSPKFGMFIALGLFSGLSIYVYRYMRGFLVAKYIKSRLKAFLYFGLAVTCLVLAFQSMLTNGIGFFITLAWLIYVPYYLYRSMRLVYQRSRAGTAVTLIVISITYFFLLNLLLLTSAAVVGFNYS